MKYLLIIIILCLSNVAQAVQFSAPQQFPDYGEDGSNPSIKTDGIGNWICCWLKPNVGIYLSRSEDDGQTWSQPSLFISLAHDDRPRLCTDGSGNWLIIYTFYSSASLSESDLYARRSSDNGLTWSDPIAVNSDAETESPNLNDHNPYIDTDGQGSWMVAWSKTDYTAQPTATTTPYYSISTDLGQTWTPIQKVSNFDTRPVISLVSNKAGSWLVITHGPNGKNGRNLYANFFSNTGVIGSAYQINRITDGFIQGPVQAIYQAGKWTTFWSAYGLIDDPNTWALVSSHTTDPVQPWSDERILNTPIIPGLREYALTITTGSADHVNLIWQTNVYDTDGTVTRGMVLRNSTDGGDSFSHPERLPIIKKDTSNALATPAADRNSSGTIVLVWREYSSPSGLWYIRATNVDQSNAVLGEDWLQYSSLYPQPGGLEKSNQLANGRQF